MSSPPASPINSNRLVRAIPAAMLGLLYLFAAPPACAFSLSDVFAQWPWLAVMFTLHSVLYSLLSFIAFYLLTVVATALFLRSGYPPIVARICCWVFFMLWLVFQFAVIFPVFVHIWFPIWFYATAFLFGLGIGVLLMVTRPRTAE